MLSNLYDNKYVYNVSIQFWNDCLEVKKKQRRVAVSGRLVVPLFFGFPLFFLLLQSLFLLICICLFFLLKSSAFFFNLFVYQ